MAATGAGGRFRFDELGWAQFELVCEGVLAGAGLDALEWRGRADVVRAAVAERVPASIASGLERPVSVAIVWVGDRQDPRERMIAALDAVGRDRSSERGPVLVLTNRADRNGDRGGAAVVLGPDELTDLLGRNASRYRTWPSLLGACELNDVLDGGAVARSRWDEPAVRALAPVFVATRAYHAAVDVLERHRFAVLSGPPEMGKTAIARIIGLALQSERWEVHECVRPDQVWASFAPERRQLFVADDAFGSTEYRPEAAERWAVELDRILRALDDHHWLLWTSRPAPLKAGLGRVHREHGVERFPQPAEVYVDAASLDVEEKALILYRHARARRLPEAATFLVKAEGTTIVEHDHFTPERINRFVSRRLPRLAPGDRRGVRAAIEAEIGQPTDAMVASFAALSPEHRALLVALVDQPPGPVPERSLAQAARRHAPAGLSKPPGAVVDRLTDHFIRLVPPTSVTWVHPSWRDLVIEELAGDAAARSRFLGCCSLDGILLALSRGGGSAGERRRPLLVTDQDWDTATDRLHRLVPELADHDLLRLLATLEDALVATPDDAELQALGTAALERIAVYLSETEVYATAAVLDEWSRAAALLDRPPRPPRSRLWEGSDHYRPQWVHRPTPFLDAIPALAVAPAPATPSESIVIRILSDL